jgi:dipeptidyl-peptidase-3
MNCTATAQALFSPPMTSTPALQTNLLQTFSAEGETFQTVFESLSPTFEECRAEAARLHLGFKDEVLEMYGVPPEKRNDFRIALALGLLHSGVKLLICFDPETCEWKHAHARAKFAHLS